MSSKQFYHIGMKQYQDIYDGRKVANKIAKKYVHHEFTEEDRLLILESSYFFIASAWQSYVDCSIKFGPRGFIKIIPPNIIEYPEYDGNSMFRSIGNLSKNPNCGLLFLNQRSDKKRLRINGFASILNNAIAINNHPNAKLVVRIECEIFPNCARYQNHIGMKAEEFERSKMSQIPSWKYLSEFRNLLPKDDPHKSIIRSKLKGKLN